MITRKFQAALAGTVLLLGAQTASFGQTAFAGGNYTFDFGGDTSVWDISGTYDEEMGGIGTSFTADVDAQGKITGQGTAWADMMGVELDGDIVLGGSITKAGSITRVLLNLKMTGVAYYDGKSHKFSATESVNAKVDPAQRLLTGTASIKAKVGGKSASDKGEFEMPISGDVDGSWTVPVQLNVDAKGRITGSGQAAISGGDSYPLGITGSFAAKSGLATLAFKSLNAASKGISLKLTARSQPGGLTLQTMTGSLMGQKVTKK